GHPGAIKTGRVHVHASRLGRVGAVPRMPAGAVEPSVRAEGAKGGRCGISTKDTTVRKQQALAYDVHNITTGLTDRSSAMPLHDRQRSRKGHLAGIHLPRPKRYVLGRARWQGPRQYESSPRSLQV